MQCRECGSNDVTIGLDPRGKPIPLAEMPLPVRNDIARMVDLAFRLNNVEREALRVQEEQGVPKPTVDEDAALNIRNVGDKWQTAHYLVKYGRAARVTMDTPAKFVGGDEYVESKTVVRFDPRGNGEREAAFVVDQFVANIVDRGQREQPAVAQSQPAKCSPLLLSDPDKQQQLVVTEATLDVVEELYRNMQQAIVNYELGESSDYY